MRFKINVNVSFNLRIQSKGIYIEKKPVSANIYLSCGIYP